MIHAGLCRLAQHRDDCLFRAGELQKRSGQPRKSPLFRGNCPELWIERQPYDSGAMESRRAYPFGEARHIFIYTLDKDRGVWYNLYEG